MSWPTLGLGEGPLGGVCLLALGLGSLGIGTTFPPSGWYLEAHLGWEPKEENLGLSKYKNRVKWGC